MSKKTCEPDEVVLSDEKCPLCSRFLLIVTDEEESHHPQIMCDRCELESMLEFVVLKDEKTKGKLSKDLEKNLKKWDAEYEKALKRKMSKQKKQ